MPFGEDENTMTFPLRWPAALMLTPLAVAAQGQAHDAPLPEITVTVNKQAENLDAVPASVSVFDGAALESAGVRGLDALSAQVPGFSFQAFGQSGVQPPVMRGLTANFVSFSSSTLLLVDGVPTLMAQGFEHNLQGVDRVEVLRGPQSTLYGRNAEAGVVSITTRQPGDTPYASISAEAGSHGQRAGSFELGRALVPGQLYIGLSGEWRAQDGFIRHQGTGDKVDDRERQSGRLALRWTPTADTEATLRYAQQRWDDGAAQWGSISAPRGTVNSGTAGWNRSRGQTLSLDVSHRFDSGLKLRSITARNVFDDRVLQDTDFQPADLLHVGRDYRLATTSQELRLEGQSQALGGARWLAGLYLDRDDHDLRYEQKLPAALMRPTAGLKGSTAALFTHWTIPLAERWTLAAGARIERNRVELAPVGAAARSDDWSRFSPKLSLQYQWSPQAQVYTSLSEGYRAGGFNVFSPAMGYAAYEPETVRAWEVGAKGRLLGQRLRYAASLYTQQVRDMQVQQMGLPGVVYITNAARARSTGLDLELDYVFGGGWQLKTALGLNRTRFGTFRDGNAVYDGRRNPFAPDANLHVALRYDAPKGWWAQAAVQGTGKVYLDAANSYRRPGYGLVHLSAGYASGPWEIAAYLRNAADRRYDAVGYLNGQVVVYSPPRELGVRLTWRM